MNDQLPPLTDHGALFYYAVLATPVLLFLFLAAFSIALWMLCCMHDNIRRCVGILKDLRTLEADK